MIVANPDRFVREANQAFDVKHILGQTKNAARFEDDDFATFRMPEIIGYSIHQKMVASEHSHLHDFLVFGKLHSFAKPGVFVEFLRDKPKILDRKSVV